MKVGGTHWLKEKRSRPVAANLYACRWSSIITAGSGHLQQSTSGFVINLIDSGRGLKARGRGQFIDKSVKKNSVSAGES